MSTVIDAAAVAERLERVRGEIAEAAREAGRSSDELTLIAVSYTHLTLPTTPYV